ncbi:MAG TPA: von Willebrand factor type A domain-containing protein [Gemmatimonadaceae bacterium]|nr:von Willebrand factor type A domain-containing protein [Gemmatimonadaceae bacterium]
MRIVAIATLILAAGGIGARFASPVAQINHSARGCPVVIEGTVTDPHHAPLADARVNIVNTAIAASSDAHGNYHLTIPCSEVQPTIQLRFLRIGYNQVKRTIAIGDSVTSLRVDAEFTTAQQRMMGPLVVAVTDGDERPSRNPRFANFRPATSNAIAIVEPFDHRSYSTVRRFLLEGTLPSPWAFGIEGLLSNFSPPWPSRAGDSYMALAVDEIPTPWAPGHSLIRASLQAHPPTRIDKPRNVVLVVETSGWFWNILPRIRDALAGVIEALGPDDRLSIVAFDESKGVQLSATTGAEHARIREALDSVEAGRTASGGKVLTVAATAARAAARTGFETHVVLVTAQDGSIKELGEADPIATAGRLRTEGIRIDVLHMDEGKSWPLMTAFTTAGGGSLLDGSNDAALHASLAAVFGFELPLRAAQPKFELRFDPARIARWRCLNDVGEDAAPRDRAKARAERLYAGEALTVLCETEPTAGNRGGGSSIRATFRDRTGAVYALNASAAPDPELNTHTRLLAQAAAFGLLLQNSKNMGAWSFDSVLVATQQPAGGDRGGYVADLRHLIDLAKRAKP